MSDLKPGSRVILTGDHPWEGQVGHLVKYGPYGLSFMKAEGWLVKLRDVHNECYAKSSQVKAV